MSPARSPLLLFLALLFLVGCGSNEPATHGPGQTATTDQRQATPRPTGPWTLEVDLALVPASGDAPFRWDSTDLPPLHVGDRVWLEVSAPAVATVYLIAGDGDGARQLARSPPRKTGATERLLLDGWQVPDNVAGSRVLTVVAADATWRVEDAGPLYELAPPAVQGPVPPPVGMIDHDGRRLPAIAPRHTAKPPLAVQIRFAAAR